MGRSKRSCLKMIACNGGGDVNDDDDISMAEVFASLCLGLFFVCFVVHCRLIEG